MSESKNQSVPIRTPDYRLRVFVSSTLKELAEERAAVREAILRLRLAPVMFESGARPHPADDLYQAYLSQCHIFIGIYWQSYGWIAPGKSVSGLEDEYHLSAGLPRLLYLKNPAEDREPTLTSLIDKIRDENAGCYKFFSTSAELRELVENDLALLLAERFDAKPIPDHQDEDAAQHPLTNIPFPRNPLIGREQELETACDILMRDDAALVTLTGPGGCGKSRLGLQVAINLRDRFADGVYLVILEVISEPEMVIPTIARTLGVTETAGGSSLSESLRQFLRQKQALLVLDNFEQVLDASPKIADLLEACPSIKILVTSRAPLRLRAERELPVPPLSLPPTTPGPHPQPLSQYAAVQLFIQRAQAVRPDFQITNENAPAVAEICHRLDGLPLAIELASSRIRMSSPEALLKRLEQSFDVLGEGTRDLPERQRTLHSAIDWSYGLLGDDEKRMLRRLSVFVGGWTFEAADAVCNTPDEGRINILDGLERLIDLNLIKPAREVKGDLRFGILETIREFSMQRLLESGEEDEVRGRQAQYYLALVEQAEPELRGFSQERWVGRLETELSNIRAVLAWCLHNDCDLGLKLCGAIWRYWETHSLIGEGRGWLEEFLAQSKHATETRGKALIAAAACAIYLGDFAAARSHVDEALVIYSDLNDKQGSARAMNELGLVALYQGDYHAAREILQESLEIKRELGNNSMIANALNNLGLVADYQGDFTSAYALHEESLALFSALEDKSGMAMAIGNLGHVAQHLGRFQEALQRQIESLRLFQDIGDIDGLAECFERLAYLSNANADFRTAAQWFGVADVLRKEAGTLPALADKLEYERELSKARMQLPVSSFDEAWAEGQGMTLVEAISRATS